MKNLIKAADLFLKVSAGDIPADVFDNPKINRIIENFLIVPEGHEKYKLVVDATINLLKTTPGAGSLLATYISNHFQMPDIIPGRNIPEKTLLVKDFLDEDDLVEILGWNKFDNKVLKMFADHPSPKVKQVVFSRLNVNDKDSQIFELENLRYMPMFDKDKHRSRVLEQLVDDKMMRPEDMPKVLKYFNNKEAPHYKYFLLFKDYVSAIQPSEAGRLLEQYPDFPSSWQYELKRKAGASDKELTKTVQNAKEQAANLLKDLNLQFGKQDKKLN